MFPMETYHVSTFLNGQSGGEDLRESLASSTADRSPEARLVRAVSGESRPDEQVPPGGLLKKS